MEWSARIRLYNTKIEFQADSHSLSPVTGPTARPRPPRQEGAPPPHHAGGGQLGQAEEGVRRPGRDGELCHHDEV